MLGRTPAPAPGAGGAGEAAARVGGSALLAAPAGGVRFGLGIGWSSSRGERNMFRLGTFQCCSQNARNGLHLSHALFPPLIELAMGGVGAPGRGGEATSSMVSPLNLHVLQRVHVIPTRVISLTY